MKKLLSLVSIVLFTFASCSSDDGGIGPQGPPGPPGEDGLDGLGWTFEETVNFQYFQDLNMYSAFITIPENVATINPNADAVLVYRLEVADGTDTWSLIPQNFFLEGGIIQYVYNHTASDVEILIDGNFNLSNLSTGFTNDQTFRVVVVPSDFAVDHDVDVSDYRAVMSALGIQENEIDTSL